MTKTVTLLICTLVMGVVASAQRPSEHAFRNWTSKDGKHEVKAAFVHYDSDARRVTLTTEAGNEVVVLVDQLSSRDKSYVSNFVTRPKLPKSDKSVQPPQERVARSNKTDSVGDEFRPARGSVARGRPMFGLRWQPDLTDALAVAQGSEKPEDDRPIMWFRVLGDLTGFM